MTTPFEKYLQDADYPPYEMAPLDPFDARVQFQLPQFMYTGPPPLAHGGGAEVLPLGTFNHTDSLAASWFANNNGFSPDEAYISSSLRSYYAPPAESYILDHQQHPSHCQESLYDLTLQQQQQHLAPMPILAPPPQTTAHDGTNVYLEEEPDSRDQHPLVPAPSPHGLVVYSATGFDVLSILARVATRPHPRVILGPVDLTCSFVVVDVRRHDHPIVYCSPSFCRLTGYTEPEVLGRNCRFLQSPDGQMQRGEPRRFTSHEAVAHLKKHLVADKECQTRIINYRKGGSAFINLVTVIPIGGGVSGLPHEENEVVYHVGFQVDLTEQPQRLLHYSPPTPYGGGGGHGSLLLGGSATGGAKKAQIAQPFISKTLKKMLADSEFVRSIPITSSTTVPLPASTSSAGVAAAAGDKGDGVESNQWLNLMLLETCSDFVHVVSLKGSFLYVAPSVRRVLGYEPEEMVGGSLADLAHPEDVVPLMRELKESSSTGGSSSSLMMPECGQQQQLSPSASSPPLSISPRTVDLLFRARTKAGVYVWVECRGRLFVEPGKGRKAIILSGRAREMPQLRCAMVHRGEREFWCMVVGGVFVVVGSRVKEVLGWNAGELVGRAIGSVVCGGVGEEGVEGGVVRRLRRADGAVVEGRVVLYRGKREAGAVLDACPGIARWPVICQIKLDDSLRIGETDVFEELETSRGSSWQYELQQLRFANQRMEDEVCLLEAHVQAAAAGGPRGVKRSWGNMD
ncbi:blue light receptor [Amanita rubescens]|nr:blue light receptor [Amanita rubescens]KAF8333263.1 blue light receptor [Amanita rubescens]